MSHAGRVLTLVTALAGCALTACADPIPRARLLERIRAGDPPRLVDVRSASEYEASHVPGAVRIPFYSLLGHLDQIPEPRSEGDPIVLYCEHGPRAGIARAQLWLAGEGPVRYMEGHMTAWKSDGLPTAPGSSETPTRSEPAPAP